MNAISFITLLALINQAPVFDQSPMFPNELFSVSDNGYQTIDKVLIQDVNGDGFKDAVYQYKKVDYPYQLRIEALMNNQNGGVKEIQDLSGIAYWVDVMTTEGVAFLERQSYNYIVEDKIYPGFVEGYVDVDWNNDGINDILAFSTIFSLYHPGFMVIPGMPDGSYDLGLIPLNQKPSPPQDRGWGKRNYGDINEDGIEDRITQSHLIKDGMTDIEIELGTPSGEFVLFDSYPINALFFWGLFPETIVLHDFNEDHHLDILRVQIENSQGTMRLGNGDGTFQEEYDLNLGYPAVFQDLGDFNGDGSADLLLVHAYTDATLPETFFISLSNRDGTFQPFRTFPFLAPKPFGNLRWSEFAVVDYNQDGLDDLWFDNGREGEDRVSGVWVNQYQNGSAVENFELYP
jgi:hypothetical protein